MIARLPKWQYKYDVGCDLGNWDLPSDNPDRTLFSKWCQYYKRLMENYDEDERPDDRMMHYDVLVDDFLKREKQKRLQEKTKNRAAGKEKQEIQGNVSFG